MNRDDLFAFAASRGWIPGTPLTDAQKLALQTALQTRLTQIELAAARVQLDGTARPMTAAEAARALVEELG